MSIKPTVARVTFVDREVPCSRRLAISNAHVVRLPIRAEAMAHTGPAELAILSATK